MLRVVLVFLDVAAVLALEVHRVFFDVGGEDVVRAHAEHLRHADEKMKQVHHLDARVLLVELLILGPPFPRDAVGEFGHFLLHGAGVVEQPLGFFLLAHTVGFHADAFVEGLLHPKEFAELVGVFHARRMQKAVTSDE